ncbi:hypothetical protein C2845_PM03G31250 [Panicum miliaceum]|uniref:Uncharacterized protein n=1 Tax=Panicum miliaceum TaxID=4540 RepID=A0A3L6TDJ0_PANMI|nr:hypothetical protein C2845_PM03G31250 [Panicum miliaceum]
MAVDLLIKALQQLAAMQEGRLDPRQGLPERLGNRWWHSKSEKGKELNSTAARKPGISTTYARGRKVLVSDTDAVGRTKITTDYVKTWSAPARKDQEGKESNVTKMVRRQLRVGVPIEEHTKEVYTRAMYERFYDELFESGTCAFGQERDTQKYIMKRWTKGATKTEHSNNTTDTSTLDAETILKRVLLTKTLAVISGNTTIVESGIMSTIQALSSKEYE